MEGDIKGFRKKVIVYQISIHAFRVEGDVFCFWGKPVESWISIHALRVEGDPAIAKGRCSRSISIHALWVEGDVLKAVIRITVCISIHALRVEGDYPSAPAPLFLISDFYPRPPGGGRHFTERRVDRKTCISIHALRVEGDGVVGFFTVAENEFLSTPYWARATRSE